MFLVCGGTVWTLCRSLSWWAVGKQTSFSLLLWTFMVHNDILLLYPLGLTFTEIMDEIILKKLYLKKLIFFFLVRITWVYKLVQDLFCFVLFFNFSLLFWNWRSEKPFQKLLSSFPCYFSFTQPYTNLEIRKLEPVCKMALNFDKMFILLFVGLSLDSPCTW